MSPFPKIRPERGDAMDAFLSASGWHRAQRSALAADASFRRYERVAHEKGIAVLMDAPPPWEDVRPFVAVSEQLRRYQLSVPEIFAADLDAGFLLLEDLGDASYTRLLRENPKRERELYLAAIDALVTIYHASKLDTQPCIPPYDMAVYLREVGLFAEWFLPQIHGIERAEILREEWLALWRQILLTAPLKQECLVHRDYHADNLFWLADRAGHHAVGMLDYQDALWGDATYDVASLLEDARRDVAMETISECVAHFTKQTGIDAAELRIRYALLAAQRNAKIIGIFTRLTVRDGKAHYLHYLPRVWGHFLKDIQHQILAPVAQFVNDHVPMDFRGAFEADVKIGGIVK